MKEWIVRDTLNNKYVQELVRCKYCQYYSGQFCNKNDVYPWPTDDWFCADGKRKSADEKLMEEMDADSLG